MCWGKEMSEVSSSKLRVRGALSHPCRERAGQASRGLRRWHPRCILCEVSMDRRKGRRAGLPSEIARTDTDLDRRVGERRQGARLVFVLKPPPAFDNGDGAPLAQYGRRMGRLAVDYLARGVDAKVDPASGDQGCLIPSHRHGGSKDDVQYGVQQHEADDPPRSQENSTVAELHCCMWNNLRCRCGAAARCSSSYIRNVRGCYDEMAAANLAEQETC